jgi:LAS superfamily LD-carboxypeptidase LdcB
MKPEPTFLHQSLSKRAVVGIFGALVLFVATIGFIEYRNHQLVQTYDTRLSDMASTTTILLNRLTDNENKIAEITARANAVEGIVVTQQDKSSALEEQVGKVNSTVGTLDRLSKTDTQLLQKYSKVYFLNENYTPKSLADINTEYLSDKTRSLQLLSNVIPYFNRMMQASKSAGLNLKVLSAYRSFGQQAQLKSNYKVTFGTTAANKFSADQGYSEHQLGTTVDFTTEKNGANLDAFVSSPESKWLVENAYQYGFILSYPAGNQYYQFEPWHWRFVGVDLAAKLHREGKKFYDEDQRVIDNYLFILFD